MARNNDLVVTAGLNIDASVTQIKKDLEEVAKRLGTDALKIKCSIDPKSSAKIQSDLNNLSKGVKIDVSSGKVDNVAMNNMANNLEDTNNKALTLKKTLTDLEDKYTKPFKAIFDNEGYLNAERTLAKIQSRLSELGSVSVVGKYGDKTASDSLERIVATIQATTGETRTLNFVLDETDDKFKLLDSSFSDKGVVKVQQDIARLKKELANFEQSHAAIKSGLTAPLKEAHDALINLESGYGSVEAVEKAINNLKTSAAEIGVNLKSANASFNIFDNAANKANNFDNIIQNLNLDIQNLNEGDKKNNLVSQLETARQKVIQLKDSEKQLGRGVEWSKSYKEINSELQQISNDLRIIQKEEQKAFKENSGIETLTNRIRKTSAALAEWGSRNKKATESNKQMIGSVSTYADKWQELTLRLQDFKNKIRDNNLHSEDIEQFRHLSEEIATFKKEADAAGLTISAFFRNMRTQMSYFIMQWVSVQGAVRILRSLAQEVTAVDTAMTELRKVTTATSTEFEEFADSAAKTGRELGASISDVINATAEFARLGETLPDAEELGRVATLYQNVGDGISEIQASEDIISTMKAFNIEAKNAIEIVDKFNEVGNNFAISSGGIGEALKRSASALAAANNDLSESIALITTANTIAQDPTTVGQGIKTVSLRLRSTKTELEELGEDAEGAAENVSKLRNQMLTLTGVDIQLDDSTYKSTYQILLEISKVWGRLDDLTRSSVLEQLFGKRQANIGAAILENGKLLQEVYEKSEGSIGSAMREQQEYAKSIQYSLDSLKAAYQGLAQTILKSDFLKSVVDTASTFLDILNKIIKAIGTLPTLLTGLAAFSGIKGVGKLKPNMPIYASLYFVRRDLRL